MDLYRDPCCGFSLYRGVKVIAIIDLVTSIFATVLFGFGLLIAIFDSEAILDDLNNYNNSTDVLPDGSPGSGFRISAGWLVFSLLAMTLVNVLYIFLARYLLYATQERNPIKLQRWFDITMVILAIRLLWYIPMLFVDGGPMLLFTLMTCTYTAYSLLCCNELRKRLLTEEESSILRDSVYFSRDANKI